MKPKSNLSNQWEHTHTHTHTIKIDQQEIHSKSATNPILYEGKDNVLFLTYYPFFSLLGVIYWIAWLGRRCLWTRTFINISIVTHGIVVKSVETNLESSQSYWDWWLLTEWGIEGIKDLDNDFKGYIQKYTVGSHYVIVRRGSDT